MAAVGRLDPELRRLLDAGDLLGAARLLAEPDRYEPRHSSSPINENPSMISYREDAWMRRQRAESDAYFNAQRSAPVWQGLGS